MAGKILNLRQIENDRRITAEGDWEFLLLLQRGLLLGLKEEGLLSQRQLLAAEERLMKQGGKEREDD